MTTGVQPPLLLVTVGTDHHPFNRLVRWVDAWLGKAPAADLRCLVQTGTSVPPLGPAAWTAYLEHGALEAAIAEAAAVVCHGGPGTILAVRRTGAVPIVVPRRHRLGEHVDDHQVAFSRRLAASRSVFLADSEAGLHRLLDRVVAEPAAFRTPVQQRGTAAAVAEFARLVGGLLAGQSTLGTVL